MYTNAYDYYGGVNPYTEKEMCEKIVKPLLGENFKTIKMFNNDRLNNEWWDLDSSLKTIEGELVYKSSSGQGTATFNKDRGIIRASVLENYSIMGVIYIKC